MLATIDLTHRQAKRVIEQALRNNGKMDIELRSNAGSFTGNLVKHQDDMLHVALQDEGGGNTLAPLIGSFCEIKIVLSGNLYLFSSCIVDATEDTTPRTLLLAVPDVAQVCNRRRFDRRTSEHSIVVQLWAPGAADPFIGTLNNIGLAGLSCRMPREGLEQLLLIEDEIPLRFQFPNCGPPFDLMAIVCVKTPTSNGEFLNIGLEFFIPDDNETAGIALARLQSTLTQNYLGSSQTDDQA
ncbi:MAG: PilZ domain-containing protein [Planctomycetota bacterium]